MDKIRFSWDNDNLNIVDARNTLLGISAYQQCCEDFSISVTVKNKKYEYQHGSMLEGYHLRTEAGEFSNGLVIDILDTSDKVAGIIEVTNIHNGYYCHNVTITHKDEKKEYEV